MDCWNSLLGRQSGVLRTALCVFALMLSQSIPGAVQAQDCEIKDLERSLSVERIRGQSQANFECLSEQVEALKALQEELRQKIEAFKGQPVPARTISTYLNSNGTVEDQGRQLGPATFVLSGNRRGRPASLELDYALLIEMCGDADGCQVTLGLEGVVIGREQIETRFSRGPCNFHIDAKSGTWALTGACAVGDLASILAAPEPESASPVWGRDGDAAPLGGTKQDGRVILAFGGACLFAESPPARRSSLQPEARLQRDTNRDLYLVAAGSDWNWKGEFPLDFLALGLADLPFQCRLTVRD